MKPKTIHLADGERILSVVPEYCSGQGWTNELVIVYISTEDWEIRQEYIQPEERTPAMHALFSSGSAIQAALLSAVPVEKEDARK